MLRESGRSGIEPATCKSQVQRPTTKPPRNGHFIYFVYRPTCAGLAFAAVEYLSRLFLQIKLSHI